jgi:methylated-DNA-[protein]-cysteine S-methyltransferase
MTLPAAIDERFRAAAAAERQLDVAYDVVDSPVGPLFVAGTERGLCRISFDPEPEREEERLARAFGPRILRSPRAVDPARRALAAYFDGDLHEFDLPLDLPPLAAFQRRVLRLLAEVPYGETTTYGTLAVRAGQPHAARAVGTVMNRNPIPIVLPCHRVVGATGKLVGYGGGLERKEQLLRLEGALPPALTPQAGGSPPPRG